MLSTKLKFWLMWMFLLLVPFFAKADTIPTQISRNNKTLWSIAHKYSISAFDYDKLLDAKTGKPFLKQQYRKLQPGTKVLIPSELVQAKTLSKTPINNHCRKDPQCVSVFKQLSVKNIPVTTVASEIKTSAQSAVKTIAPVKNAAPKGNLPELKQGKQSPLPAKTPEKSERVSLLPYIGVLVIILLAIASLHPREAKAYAKVISELARGETREKLAFIEQDLKRQLPNFSFKIDPLRARIQCTSPPGDLMALTADLYNALKAHYPLGIIIHQPHIKIEDRPHERSNVYMVTINRVKLIEWDLNDTGPENYFAIVTRMERFAKAFFKEFQYPHTSYRNFMESKIVPLPEQHVVELWISPGEGYTYPTLTQHNLDLSDNIRDAYKKANDPVFTVLENEMRESYEQSGKTFVVIPFYLQRN